MHFIYKIENNISKKVYIGQTINYTKRIRQHKYHLRKGDHDNKYLQKDFNEYGLTSFKFSIIEECDDIQALERETYWINYYEGIESSNTYNMVSLDGLNTEFKLKVKQGNIGKKRSKETCNKLSEIGRAKKHSLETKIKISKSCKGKNKGHFHSDETKVKISKSCKGRTPVNKGKRKYEICFINRLCKEYLDIKNYSELGRKYNINVDVIRNLILYGTPANPKCYKK